MQNRVVQSSILPPIRFLASPARKMAGKDAALIAREVSDSLHRKNAALRFSSGQYTLKYVRATNHVSRIHEARYRAGTGKRPLGERRALRCRDRERKPHHR